MQYCLAIEKYDQNILGGAFMRNYNIEFDRERELLRFTRSNCGLTDSFYTDYPDVYPMEKESIPKVIARTEEVQKLSLVKTAIPYREVKEEGT